MKITLVLHKYDLPLDDPCCFPLGYMYVSAMLKRLGHHVKVLNYNLWDYDLVGEIHGQDLVCFTGFEEFLPRIIRDATICEHAGIRTLLGGALATFEPQRMLDYVDVVVTGEAEQVLVHALHAAGGEVHGSMPDFKNLPWPDYEGFGIGEYNRFHPYRYVGVLTSRGCPHRCRFCAHICAFQLRPLDHVFEEIDHYRKDYGAEMIVFNDNTLNVSRGRFLEICKRMRARCAWTCAIRVDHFDEECARAARDSGCMYMVVGVESFYQEKLDMMQKGITVEQIKRALDLLHKYRIRYHGNILLGFEGETYEDITRELEESMLLGYSIFPAMVQPFVGTQCGRRRAIDRRQYLYLDACFRAYIEHQGKYCYHDLQAVNA